MTAKEGKPNCPVSPRARTAWQARWEREFRRRWIVQDNGGYVPAPGSGYGTPKPPPVAMLRAVAPPTRPRPPPAPRTTLPYGQQLDAALMRAKGG